MQPILDQPELADPTQFVWTDPDRLSGAPCFRGTRVPVDLLFEYLEAGESLESFLEGFPGVSREQAIGVLKGSAYALLEKVRAR